MVAPTYHCTYGSFQARTWLQRWNQWNSSAALPQNASGSSIDWR